MSYDKLQPYFTYFHNLFSSQLVENLENIEKSFTSLNYEQHIDDISQLFYTEEANPAINLQSNILSIYIEHINSVLAAQGVFLKNPYTDKIELISDILHCITVFAITPIEELIDMHLIDHENDDCVFIALAVSSLCENTMESYLDCLDSVSSSTIEYLRNDEIVPNLTNEIAIIAESRFKASPLQKYGIIVEAIKKLNRFGYSLKTFLTTYSYHISEKEDIKELANEIILLVLGSDTNNRFLQSEALQASEIICENTNVMLLVNNEINKYFKENKYE